MKSSHASIASFLGSVRVLEPIRFQALTVYPLAGGSGEGPAYRILDDALRTGSVTIGEVTAEGRIPELLLENRGEEPVFILDGEVLEGGKQTRVLNVSVLVGARSKTAIPVSCVEQGRWSYRKTGFASPAYAHSKLRAMKARMASDAIAMGRGHTADQGAIWKEVHHLHRATNTSSPTGEYLAGLEAARKEREEFLYRVRLPKEATGAAVAHGSRLLSVDLFDRAETLEKLWGKVSSGLILDLFREGEAVAGAGDASPSPWSVIDRAAAAEWKESKAVAAGEEARLREADLVGSALLADGRVLHVSLFPVEPEPQPEPRGDDLGSIQESRLRDLARRRQDAAW